MARFQVVNPPCCGTQTSFLEIICLQMYSVKDPRCSFERLMIFLQNITQMMLNNPNINNQFKFHPQDGRFVEIWENRAMP